VSEQLRLAHFFDSVSGDLRRRAMARFLPKNLRTTIQRSVDNAVQVFLTAKAVASVCGDAPAFLVCVNAATAFYEWLLRSIPSDATSLRYAARITIAAMAAYLVAGALNLPESLWAVITGLIVVQTSVGGTIGAGLDRLVGTLVGALVGGATASVHALWPVLPVGLLLLISVAPLSLFVVKRPSYRVAPVTVALMLLLVHDQAQPLTMAYDRVIEITIGCLIGVAASMLVLPYRAEDQLIDGMASGLRLLAQLVLVQFGERTPADLARIDTLNERMRTLLAACETTVIDARRESKMYLGGRGDPEPRFRILRRLRGNVPMIDRAMTDLTAADADGAALPLPDLRALAAAIAHFLEAAAQALAARAPPPALDPVDEAIAASFGARPPDRLLQLGFAIEALRRDCGDLHDRIAERVALAVTEAG